MTLTENKSGAIITINRHGKSNAFKSTLVTVLFGSLTQIMNGDKLKFEDMYVHSSGSATNCKGFHAFLEKFIGWDLPEVPTNEETDRKLYMQLLFSAFVVEQKRGWGGFLNGLNTKYNIKDANKRVIEFILGLESLETEKKKIKFKKQEEDIRAEWVELTQGISMFCRTNGFVISDLPETPTVLDETFKNKINIFKAIDEDTIVTINEYFDICKYRLDELSFSDIPIISANSKYLEEQVQQIQSKCNVLESELVKGEKEKSEIQSLINDYATSISILKTDLQHNKDALKIKNMGSLEDFETVKGHCHLCNKAINDTLINQSDTLPVMSLETNIKYILGQIDVVEFSLKRENVKYRDLEQIAVNLETELIEKRSQIRNIKSDLYSPNNGVAESLIREKIVFENKIAKIKEVNEYVTVAVDKFKSLSLKIVALLADKVKLPTEKFTEEDNKKINTFEIYFKNNLKKFGFSSTGISEIKISRVNFMPEIDGFKLAYDASASDYIRAIWAFNLALMQTSIKHSGNHSNILFFDEPKQQSTTQDHATNFFNEILNINADIEVVIGITSQDEDTKKAVAELSKSTTNIIVIDGHSVKSIKK